MRLNFWYRRNQRYGVGVLRFGKDAIHWANLNDLSEVHHSDAIREVADDIKVMADEEVGEPLLVPKVGQQVKYLALNRNVECGDRLIENDEFRINGEGAGDADALALAAREFVRIARRIVWIEADKVEHLAHTLLAGGMVAELVGEETLFDLIADR